MKVASVLVLVFGISFSHAQKKEMFYDFFWKSSKPEDARYYSTLEKTDSGWLRNDYYVHSQNLQMRALYADEDCKVNRGDYFYFHANGVPSSTGRMINGKQEGVCMRYHSNGMVLDSAYYRNGQVADKRFRWYRNGNLSDSISRVNDSMHVQAGWFETGSPAYGGYLVHGAPDRKWRYYHHNGQLSAEIVYVRGEQKSAMYFDENGNALADTSDVNREAAYKSGDAGWRKYLSKNLRWPGGLQFNTPASVTVGVTFAIDDDGKVIDAEVTTPFHKAFDEIALKIIRGSAAWNPAIVNNRKVKAYRVQPVTFVGE